MILELGTRDDEVFLWGDSEEIAALGHRLIRLSESSEEGPMRHAHLMSEEWAGSDLENRTTGQDRRVIHHLKVYAWKPTLDEVAARGDS